MSLARAFLLITLALTGALPVVAQDARPNVVLIYGDDVGYGDLGCYGAEKIPTPNLDRLAKAGLRFTDGHCSAATCTPSRFSLLTGIHGFRHRVRILPPNAPLTIQPDMYTLPRMFRDSGYATAVVGKWHLGIGDGQTPVDWNADVKPGPLEVGFEYSFLLPSTNDRVPCVYVENHRVVGLDPSDPLFVGAAEARGVHRHGVSGRQDQPRGDDLLSEQPRARPFGDRRHRSHRLPMGRQGRAVERRDDGRRLRRQGEGLARRAERGAAVLPVLLVAGHPRAARAAPALSRPVRAVVSRGRDGAARLGRGRAARGARRARLRREHDRDLHERQRPGLRRRLRGRHDGADVDAGGGPGTRRLGGRSAAASTRSTKAARACRSCCAGRVASSPAFRMRS